MNDSEAASGVGRFLTLADTAEILSLTNAEVLELVRTGELPAIRLGTRSTSAGGADAIGSGSAGVWRVERVVLESSIEAKYEESRRIGLWNQAEYSDLPEYSFDRSRRPQTRTSDS